MNTLTNAKGKFLCSYFEIKQEMKQKIIAKEGLKEGKKGRETKGETTVKERGRISKKNPEKDRANNGG